MSRGSCSLDSPVPTLSSGSWARMNIPSFWLGFFVVRVVHCPDFPERLLGLHEYPFLFLGGLFGTSLTVLVVRPWFSLGISLFHLNMSFGFF